MQSFSIARAHRGVFSKEISLLESLTGHKFRKFIGVYLPINELYSYLTSIMW